MSSSNDNELRVGRVESILIGSDEKQMRLEKYDKSTYLGRVFYFQDRMSLRHLMANEKHILQCKELVDLAKSGHWNELKLRGVKENDLQEANCVVNATIHPQSKEIISPAVRMAAFCPINIPICAGMLLTRPTIFNSVLWQWVNQTYNAVFNFAQSNKEEKENTTKKNEKSFEKCKMKLTNLNEFKKCTSKFMEEYEAPLRGYMYATGVSVGLAISLNEWLKRGRFSVKVKNVLQAIVPYTAVAAAGVANVSLMRYNEIKQGIPVYSRYGEYIGHSREAAKTAVWQTAFSRVVLSFPVLALPPPILSLCYRIPFLYSNTIAKVITELSVIYGGLYLGLPLAVAIFPQEAYMNFKDIDKSLQGYVDPYGREIKDVVFNKGI